MRHKPLGHAAANDELNLIPYLDIVVNLVMFLLLAADFSAPLTEIRFGARPAGDGPAISEPEITVAITADGYRVFGDAPWAGSIPRRGADLDVDGLTAHLVAASRSAGPVALPSLTITAEDQTDLGRVVSTIDAVRSAPDGTDLFPAFRFGKLTLPAGG